MEKIKENKIQIILGIIVFVLLNYLFYYFRYTFKGDAVGAISYLFSEPKLLLYAFPLSINTLDLLIPLIIATGLTFILIDKKNNQKKYRKGKEHGSAEWGVPHKELKGMFDEEKPYNNIIFSQNTKITLDDKKVAFENRRNKNTLIVGGSGSGKTRYVVKPNLLQMNASYVVTDPKGTIINELGMALKTVGKYKIKILNTVNFNKSMHYNPLAYVDNEQDILKLVDTIILNTTGNGEGAKEDFWVKSEKLLYQAYLSMIISKFPEEERNLPTLMEMISYSTVKEDDENYKNAVDYLFEELEEEDPDHFAVKQYRAFKLAAGKTTKSILISCATRLAPLNIPAVRDLLSKDELDLRNIGERKTALFVIVPDTDSTFNFIVSIMYTQLFNQLCTIADDVHGGSLPVHVRCILDEFANIGLIPNFDKLIATIRSRNISATVILQTMSQLKPIYKENADTIIGNCDTSVFLGGKETSTIKALNEELGKETIDDYNESRTRSSNDSYGQNYSKLGRDLISKDELLRLDRTKCIVQVIGKRPFLDDKYKLEQHPRYKYHAKGKDKKYWFDIEKYLQALENQKIKVRELRKKQRIEGRKEEREIEQKALNMQFTFVSHADNDKEDNIA